MRTLLTVEANGLPLAATAHLPEAGGRDVGVLLLSFGHVPRSGVGDLSARLADRLAAAGVPAFRIDLPGLGDSPGEVEAEEHEFFAAVQRGDHAPVATELADRLRERYALPRLVLGGLCGGGVTAIFAADSQPGAVAGLLLIEPDFSLAAAGASLAAAGTARGTRLTSTRSWVRLLTGESRFARYLPLPRRLGLSLARRLLRRSVPADANLRLIDASSRNVERGIPTLCLLAEGKLRDVYTRAVQGAALGDGRAPTQIVALPGTNHVLSAGGAQERAFELVLAWVAGL